MINRDDLRSVIAIHRDSDWLQNRAQQQSKLDTYKLDLRNTDKLSNVLDSVTPEWIFHLASTSSVGNSFREPAWTFDNNVQSQLQLLEAIRDQPYNPRIILALSGEEYGIQDENSGNGPFNPVSPYAVSKVTQDLMGYQYHKSYDMEIVRLRVFPHIGPRQSKKFLIPTIVRQLIRVMERRKPPVVELGDPTVERDFTDVRDIVRAYVLAAEEATPGRSYDVCSGETHTVEEIVDRLVDLLDCEVSVEADDAQSRPSNPARQTGDNSSFRSDTGWEPEIEFNQTLVDTYQYWRNKLIDN